MCEFISSLTILALSDCLAIALHPRRDGTRNGVERGASQTEMDVQDCYPIVQGFKRMSPGGWMTHQQQHAQSQQRTRGPLGPWTHHKRGLRERAERRGSLARACLDLGLSG